MASESVEESVFEELHYETVDDGRIGIITLDRPEARNALTFRTYAELDRALRQSEARCLIVTGRDPGFCAGDDVKLILGAESGPPTEALEREPRLTPAAEAMLYGEIPIIAAVNGAAVGWGMELALLADFRIASDRARFGELFVLRGICCDVAGLGRLAQLVGREKAAELLFTGEIIDAEEALRIGLVGRTCPHAELMERSLELARRIAANPPLAVARLRAGLRRALDPDWRELGPWVSKSIAELFGTEDHKEGVQAFLQKRPARYVGR